MEKILHCNSCGRKISEEQNIYREDFFEGKKEWNYFSDKDGSVDYFVLCEGCYDQLVNNFIIPIRRDEKTELL